MSEIPKHLITDAESVVSRLKLALQPMKITPKSVLEGLEQADIIYFANGSWHLTENLKGKEDKYPLMIESAKRIAKLTMAHINLEAERIRGELLTSNNEESDFPYKAQFILEEVTRILQNSI